MPANPLPRPNTIPIDDAASEPIVRVVEKEHTSNSLTPYWVPWALGLMLMAAVVITVGITDMAAPIAGIMFALGLAVATIGVARQAFRALSRRWSKEDALDAAIGLRNAEEQTESNVVPLSPQPRTDAARTDSVKSATQGGSRR